MRVATCICNDQRGNVFGKLCVVVRSVRLQYLTHAGYLCSLGGSIPATATRHQQVDLASDFCGRGHGIESCALERLIVVFGNDKNAQSDHLRFVLEFLYQLGHISNDHASAAFCWLRDLGGRQAWRHIDAEVSRFDCFERLLLRLHDVG